MEVDFTSIPVSVSNASTQKTSKALESESNARLEFEQGPKRILKDHDSK